MQKNSKVIKVTPNGTWDSQYGLKYKFEIEMENGDIGEYNSKTVDQTKFIEGQKTDYEFTDHEKFPKINPIYNFQPKANNPNIQNDIRWAQSINIANLQLCHGLITKDQFDNKASEMYEKLKNGKPENQSLPFEKAPF